VRFFPERWFALILSDRFFTVLYNWKRKDASQPVTLDNIDIVSGFLGPDSVSEAWFYCATVGIEAVGAPTLKLLVECQELAEQGAFD
jgi:indoleamine 2,3-dioxygenase